jgi:hypothetical protein
MVTEIELFEFGTHCSSPLPRLRFYLWGCIKSGVYKRKVDTRDELLALILDSATRIKIREDHLRRTTRHLRTRAAKCTEIDGGIFEHLL